MTIIYLAVLWCLGIWTAIAAGGAPALWLSGTIVTAIVTLLHRRRYGKFVPVVYVTIFCAGGLRASITSTSINVIQIADYGNDAEVTIVGTIADQPRVHDTRVDLTLQVESIHGAGISHAELDGRVLLKTPRFPTRQYGERIRATGTLSKIENWSEFDYREYLARQNIYYQMSGARIERLEQGAGNAFYHRLYTFHAQAAAVIATLFPDPERSLLNGILLGDDTGMSKALRDAFRATGMSHIIAISGFNIAVLAGVLLRSSRRLLGLRASGWFAMGGVFVYTLFVGADAAVVRAAIMGSLYIFSNRVLGRPAFAPAGLFLAALLMSLFKPFVLWEIGFQLSFAATLGLMLFVQPASRTVREKLLPILPEKHVTRLMPLLVDIVIVTLAAQLMSLPLLAYHFGEISLVSFVANLLVLPAQPAVMLWGGTASLIGLLSPALATPFAWVAWLFLAYTTRMVQLLASLPLTVVDAQIDLATVVLFYCLLLAFYWFARQSREKQVFILAQVRGRAAQGLPTLLALTLGLTLIWTRTQPDGYLHVSFFDVGQGDAIFIQTPSGRQILVDGGQFPSMLMERLGQQLPFWDHQLDIVVATHPDDDHVAGLPGLFQRYEAEMLVTNGAETGASAAFDLLLQEAQAQGMIVHSPLAGERLVVDDGVEITFVHPVPETTLQSDNDSSVALRVRYGRFSLLLTGDAELEAERAMVATGLPLDALVFKAGHHGSRSSSNAFFLDQVQPQVVVVSAGEGNRFGHPHAEVLQRAEAIGATILRTDEVGTIEVTTDGVDMWWQTSR